MMKKFILMMILGLFWLQNVECRVIVIPSSTPPEKLYKEIHQAADQDIIVLADKEPALEKLEKSYQNSKVWMTASGDVSFYAGLFKQVKLEDVYEGRILISLRELAGSHAIGTVKSEAVRKYPYAPAKGLSQPVVTNKNADLVIFSFDRPLQLYAFLESTKKYVKGLGEILVIYRSSDEKFKEGYDKVQRRFKDVKFLSQGKEPAKDFKPLFLKATFESPSPYVLFAVDDMIVKNHVDLHQCTELLGKTGAYGYYLRLGSHVDYCYMRNADQKIPPSWEIEKGIFAWQFKQGEYDWKYPCSVDMSIYKKSEIEAVLKKIDYHNPNLLESQWALKARYHKMGLYFDEAKVVNLPLNMVNQSNIWGNRQMHSLTPHELLEKLQAGLKIDISPFFQVKHRSPHIDEEVAFVPCDQ
jgi:hypothetical protein